MKPTVFYVNEESIVLEHAFKIESLNILHVCHTASLIST